jgi:hypothetical protein
MRQPRMEATIHHDTKNHGSSDELAYSEVQSSFLSETRYLIDGKSTYSDKKTPLILKQSLILSSRKSSEMI